MTMAYEIPGFRFSAVSKGNIAKFAPVKVTGPNEVEQADAGEAAVGVAQMEAKDDLNEPITVMNGGISFVYFGAGVSAGEEVEVGSDGKVIEQDSGEVVGVAMVSGASDELGCILLK